MKNTLRGGWIIALTAGLVGFGGCGDSYDVTTLHVVETVAVDFGGMEGGVADSLGLSLAPLQDHNEYQLFSDRLRCAYVEETSHFAVDRLVVTPGATVLDFTVEVSNGDGYWTRLLSFKGSVADGAVVSFGDRDAVVADDGLRLVQEVTLAGTTGLGVRVTALVPANIDALEVSTHLHLAFSTDAADCH